jgi:hypothetical protein
MKIFLLAIIFCFGLFRSAVADDNFYSHADEQLESEHFWMQTSFDKSAITAVFRAWIPYKAEQVWNVLNDVNHWAKMHKDFTDARAISADFSRTIEAGRPQTIDDVMLILGNHRVASFNGQDVGHNWTQYFFQRLNLPWPFNDRWSLIKAKADESNHKKNQYQYDYKILVGNMKDLRGHWKLMPVPQWPGWTEWRGEYTSDPDLHFPKFVARKVVTQSMERSMQEKLKELAKRYPDGKAIQPF